MRSEIVNESVFPEMNMILKMSQCGANNALYSNIFIKIQAVALCNTANFVDFTVCIQFSKRFEKTRSSDIYLSWC